MHLAFPGRRFHFITCPKPSSRVRSPYTRAQRAPPPGYPPRSQATAQCGRALAMVSTNAWTSSWRDRSPGKASTRTPGLQRRRREEGAAWIAKRGDCRKPNGPPHKRPLTKSLQYFQPVAGSNATTSYGSLAPRLAFTGMAARGHLHVRHVACGDVGANRKAHCVASMVVADHWCSSRVDGIVEFRYRRGGCGLAGEESTNVADRAHQRCREHHRGVFVHPQLDQSLQIAQLQG